MMIQKHESKITQLVDVMALAELAEQLDQLHSAVSEGQFQRLTFKARCEALDWLQEIIYTAQETIHELDKPGSRTPARKIIELPATLDRRQA